MEVIILENFLWSFITMLRSIDIEIIILENFAISEMKNRVLALKWRISCLRKTKFKCTNLMEKVGCLNSWTPCIMPRTLPVFTQAAGTLAPIWI